jgi:hypothetical protein
MGHKRDRNKPQPEVIPNLKVRLEDDMRAGGFDPMQMTEFEKALLVQIGTAKNEIVDAIDQMGAMLEDVLGERMGEVDE